MPRRRFDLGQRPSARERMADERVPPVVDRQPLETLQPEHLASRPEPLADRVPNQARAEPTGPQATDEVVLVSGAVRLPFLLPCRKIFERPLIPPERPPASPPAFGALRPDVDVW